MRRVYLDSNATTPVLPRVLEAIRPCFEAGFGNASSVHRQGQIARAAVESARQSVGKMFNCRAADVVFTSGGTEADNLAIFGTLKSGDHVITSAIEHHAVLHACDAAKKRGVEVTVLPVNGNCEVSPDDLRRALRKNTRLVTIMMANNETGSIQPLEEFGKIAAEAGAIFHTDAVQAAGKIPIDVEKIGCHLLSVSGHKFHAPQGIGALFIRKDTLVEPLFFGGSHERQRRAGTENVPGIVGIGKAADLAVEGLSDGTIQKIAAMRDRLETGLLDRVEGSKVNAAGANRVPNTTNMQFGVEGEALTISLDLRGLCVSAGAACSSGATEPSHVLSAMGLTPEQARGSIRISIGKHNTEEDIDFALEIIPAAVERLRELSPAYAK
jgi:cysteine desulfurase